jgi:alginate O-acetyltransferase complex protein AlgI
MEFTSLKFIFVFLPIFLVIYITIRKYTLRLSILLIASILFIYAGERSKSTLFWSLAVISITYWIGYLIDKNKQNDIRLKINLWVGIIGALLILTFFKMFSGGYGDGFINILLCENELSLCNGGKLIVPLGISFLVFQSISYLVDVSKNQISHERNIFKFLSWALFYPKLVSGPLVSYKNIQEQLNKLETNIDDIASGLRLIFTGIIKRLLIANQVGFVANAVFGMPANGVTPLFAWVGLLAYTIQIYFDFSGYTDIAIGLGKIIGIRLPENFNYPYIAESVTDFWRRWHITLSTWFREYVFFPLERKRWALLGRQVNILIVFLLTGLWHGFGTTFIIWGLLHGLAIAIETVVGNFYLNKIPRLFRHFYTLSIILLGWVFFRSPTVEFAIEFIKRLLGNTVDIVPLPFSITTPLPFIEPTFILALTAGILFSIPIYPTFKVSLESKKERPTWLFVTAQALQDFLLLFLFSLAIAAQVAGSFAPNIYANF